MTGDPHKPNGTHRLIHFWPIIVVAAAALTGYGTLLNRVAAAETALQKAETKQERQADEVQRTAVAVAEVKTEVKAVKQQLDDANRKLDRLLERR